MATEPSPQQRPLTNGVASSRRARAPWRSSLPKNLLLWLSALPLILCQACELPVGDLMVITAGAPELARASTVDGTWESAPWNESDAPWLSFPGRASLQLEHDLGVSPRSVLVYISFDPNGADPALAAGDLTRIIEVDPTTLTIRNDTNVLFYARVVAY